MNIAISPNQIMNAILLANEVKKSLFNKIIIGNQDKNEKYNDLFRLEVRFDIPNQEGDSLIALTGGLYMFYKKYDHEMLKRLGMSKSCIDFLETQADTKASGCHFFKEHESFLQQMEREITKYPISVDIDNYYGDELVESIPTSHIST